MELVDTCLVLSIKRAGRVRLSFVRQLRRLADSTLSRPRTVEREPMRRATVCIYGVPGEEFELY